MAAVFAASPPPSTPSSGRPRAAVFAALDIGGTKIAGGLVGEDGSLLFRTERPTPSLQEVLDELIGHPMWTQAVALGIACAGPVDPVKGTVSPINIPAWRDFPLSDVVESSARLPVTLTGDAIAMAAGEHWRGAARGYSNVLCLVVSTGVGGGLILDGQLRQGPSGNAGHVGHISVDLDGMPCPCGGRGCVEGLASGPAIARRAGMASAADVAVAARDGNPMALAAFDRAAQALAAGIAATATLVDLEAVVIGGGVARAGELLFTPLWQHLTRYAALPYVHGLHLHPARLGQDAGLVGAAAHARGVTAQTVE